MTRSTRTGVQPRRRIIEAALELAATGGYEALQVRTLSERAEVSSRTIYRHFPSLDSLLIVAVAEQSQGLHLRFVASPPKGKSAAIRVNKLIADLTATMTANRTLTVALLRALLSGKPDVAPWVDRFGKVLSTLLTSAVASGVPTAHDRRVAEILEGVWFSTIVGWATGADTDRDIHDVMRRSTRTLLGTGQ